ncbi:hypothetical protein JW949_03695 [Candidatus Woesearchaeota archaeon]|nr:hypothetical protein [Candidatus Woesearchaeota archaeon]
MEHIFHKYVAIKDSEHFMIKVYAFPECLPYEEISRQQEIGFVNLNCVPEIPEGKNIEKVISENIDFIGSEIHRITKKFIDKEILKDYFNKSIMSILFEKYLGDLIKTNIIEPNLDDYINLKIQEEILFLEDNKLMNEEEWVKQYKQI